MKSFIFLLPALIALTAVPALCQDAQKKDIPKESAEKAEPIDTDRGNFTNGIGTVPKGSYQIETGVTLTRLDGARQFTFGEVLLRVPLSAKSEIRLGLNSYETVTGSGPITFGFQDVSIGYKFKVREQIGSSGWGCPGVAVNVSTLFPSGSNSYREKVLQPSALLIFSRDVTEKFSTGVNIGYGYLSSGGQRFSQWIGSVSGQFKLNPKTTLFVEYIGVLPGGPGNPNANYFDTGILFLLTDSIQLDARIGKGTSGARPDDFIGFGASYRWK